MAPAQSKKERKHVVRLDPTEGNALLRCENLGKRLFLRKGTPSSLPRLCFKSQNNNPTEKSGYYSGKCFKNVINGSNMAPKKHYSTAISKLEGYSRDDSVILLRNRNPNQLPPILEFPIAANSYLQDNRFGENGIDFRLGRFSIYNLNVDSKSSYVYNPAEADHPSPYHPRASSICCKSTSNSLKPQEICTDICGLDGIIDDNSQRYPKTSRKSIKGWISRIICTEISASDKNVIVYGPPQPKNKMIGQEISETSKIETDTPLKRSRITACGTDQEVDEEIKDGRKIALESFEQDKVLTSRGSNVPPRQLKEADVDRNLPCRKFKKLLDENDLQAFIQQSIDNRSLGLGVFSTGDLQEILKFRTIHFSSMPKNPVKIGEASFSEVFLVDGDIHKIIPFNEYYGIEAFCKEVFVLETLKEEKGICKIIDGFLVKGKYSKEYIKAWKNYKSVSENIDPSGYKQSQTFGVIVMNDCGEDLEKYQFKDCSEVIYFIFQLLSAICTLETKYRFEHRDLHWGNIMVKSSEIFLIDFNFTRLETTKVVYTDLNQEPWLFEGDPSIDVQFDVYKRMKVSCKNDWVSFNGKSNLLWVVYLFDKLHFKIRTLKVNEDKFKTTRIVQILENEARRCKSTQELLSWFEKHILNK